MVFMEKIFYFLRFQDLFEFTFQYFFNKKRKQHSILTMIISLIINSLTITIFINEIYILSNHKHPNVNYAKMRQTFSPNFTFNSEDLLFSIGMRDKYYNFINDPTIAKIKGIYEHTTSINRKIIQKQYTLSFMNCTNIYNIYEKKEIKSYYESNAIQEFSCFNYSEPIIIGGQYGTSFYGNLAFYIIKCKNGTEDGIICKSEEEIENLIQDGWLEIAFITSYIDYKNYTNPVKYIIHGQYSKLDVSLNKISYLYFSQIQTETDNGWFFPSKSNIFSTEFDYGEYDMNKGKDDGIFITVYVCPSPTLEVFFRKYTKIQEITALIGGLFTASYFLFFVIIKYFTIYKYDIIFGNSLFFFNFEKPVKEGYIFYGSKKLCLDNINIYKNKGIQEIDSSNGNLKVSNTISNFRINSPSKINISKEIKNIYEIKLNIVNTLRLGMDRIFKKGKILKKQYRLIKHLIINYSDIINIGKNIIDFETINSFLCKNYPKENALREKSKKIKNLNIKECFNEKQKIFSKSKNKSAFKNN